VIWRIIILIRTFNRLLTLRDLQYFIAVVIGEERIRQRKKVEIPHNIPWEEWRRRLAMLPEEVVKRTVLDATTQFYMQVENENRDEPREDYKSRCPGLWNFRQHETVVSDTYFPTQITNQGHTCSQLFVGLDSVFWVTLP
jgi:hypothetical protein